MNELTIHYLSPAVELSETPKRAAKVQLLRTGEWIHPQAPGGRLKVTSDTLRLIYDNFKAGVVGTELPCDRDHEDPKKQRALGWISGMEIDSTGSHLYGYCEFSDNELAEDVRTKKIKYFSPEIKFGYLDKEKNARTIVIDSGSWTNKPYIKGMEPAVNLSEVAENDAELTALMRETAESYGSTSAEPNVAKDARRESIDPDAGDPDLPTQCGTCLQLQQGKCPFPNVEIKIAAAADGICPRYTPLDSKRPESDETGGLRAQSKTQEVKMSEITQNVSLTEFETLKEQVTKLSEANQATATENAALKAEKEKLAEKVQLHETMWEKSEAIRLAEADARYAEEAVRAGHLTPAQAELAAKIRKASRGETVKLNETDETASTFDALFNEFVNSLEVGVEMAEGSYQPSATRSSGASKTAIDDSSIQRRAEELAKSNGSSRWQDFYGSAAREVLAGGK